MLKMMTGQIGFNRAYKWQEIITGSLFLDEETIKAILGEKEQAEASLPVRALDYISLDGGSNHGAAEGLSDE
ncbi:hypothetical protein K1719_044895 [Acacia pycnantha]|nr:hypothetical protein K1719_044895 [Acacia pycnantha]